MWLSKGRSGIGDKNIDGTYEDWNGLSPNGRQFKNPLTDEVRNLSGADYWHVRKSMNLHQWEGQNLFLPNGMANTDIFAEDYVETNQTSSSPKLSYRHPDCVLPGEEFIDLLDQLELVTYKMYKEGMISKDQWFEEKADIDRMRDKEYDRYLKSQLGK